MEKKMVSGIMLIFILIGIMLEFNIEPVRSEPTKIWVPLDYPTIQEAINAASNGDRIIVVGYIPPESVVVNKSVSIVGYVQLNSIRVVADNVFISGFLLTYLKIAADNVTVIGLSLGSDWYPYGPAIVLEGASGCNISQVYVGNIDEGPGIFLVDSHNNIIANSVIDTIQVWDGCIAFKSSHNNTIFGNTFWANFDPSIYLKDSSGNKFYNNYFYTYWAKHIRVLGNSTNVWDAGYPDGGNYWNDYNGTDLYAGPYQNETGSDGIGDNPYAIDANNTDNYPLMSPMPWDITGPIKWLPDGQCDIRDIALVAFHFGSVEGDGRYDARADMTGPVYLVADGKTDIRDIALTAIHFGE